MMALVGFCRKRRRPVQPPSPLDSKAACTLKRERRPGKAAFWNPPNLFWGWGGIGGALLRFLAPFVALLVRLSAFLAAVGRLVGSFVGGTGASACGLGKRQRGAQYQGKRDGK